MSIAEPRLAPRFLLLLERIITMSYPIPPAKFIPIALASAVACAFAAPVIAEPEDEKALETVEVVGKEQNYLNVETGSGALGSRAVLNTPFSVTSISAEDMAERQVNSLETLFGSEASVAAEGSTYSGFGTNISVRGLPLDYTNSYKINGLSANNFSGELPYEAFERVDLLKGATGFMYGFAAPGGVVNYVTKSPVDSFGALAFGYRNDSVLSAHLDVSDRWGADDQIGARLNLVKESGDIYQKNDAEIDRQTVALAFEYRITDALTWDLDLIYNDRQVDNATSWTNNSLSSGDALPEPLAGDANLAVDGTFNDHKNLIALSGLKWQFSDSWSASLQLAKTDNDND